MHGGYNMKTREKAAVITIVVCVIALIVLGIASLVNMLVG